MYLRVLCPRDQLEDVVKFTAYTLSGIRDASSALHDRVVVYGQTDRVVVTGLDADIGALADQLIPSTADADRSTDACHC